MNKSLFAKLLPHIIAFVVFLLVAVIYCRPVLDDKVLQQHDITQWQGAIQQSLEFKEKHGHMPLWTNSMFAGMPTFQIGAESNNYIPGYLHMILTMGLPAPIQFFFLACICFYFLCITLRVSPWLGILGALGFAYATYNPVIIVAGHATKMWAMAYMPAVLGSLILIFEKRYWLGAALTALFTSTMVAMNHPQIVYYFFLAAAIMTLFFVVRWIRAGEFRHLAMVAGFTIVAAVTGLLVNSVTLLSTYEYQKETIRGGSSVLTDTTQAHLKSATGLDKDYAFSYSAAIPEPLVLLVPRMYGGSAGGEEVAQEKSKAIEALSSLPRELQQQLGVSMRYYWGGISQDGRFGGTSGPPYSGAIVCFLALLSFFMLDGKHKWWALAAIGLTVVMSWGYYFKSFNYFLFDYLPFYNKFRAPSMALVIPQLLLPMLAVLGVNAMIQNPDKKDLLARFKKGMIATGGLFVLLFLLYFSFDFLTKGDSELLRAVRDANQPQLLEAVKGFYDGLVADRKGLMMGDIFRSLGFIAVAAVTLWFLIKKTIQPAVAIGILAAFSFIDLIVIDSNYLNADKYQDRMENEAHFQRTKADDQILADKSYYRVFNYAGDFHAEAYTSYLYNSIGGYHAVKLRLFQDIIERQLATQQPNLAVLNMLNAKYIIQKDQRGVTQQAQPNPGALGPVWFVKHVSFVKNADEEMAALNDFNPRDTAFVQEAFRGSVPFLPAPDSTATISLVSNENDVINYTYSSPTNQFAVFSEVYYKAGWRAFVNGKETPIVKTNYVLRGLALPAGQNVKVEFRFEPQGYLTGKTLTTIFTIILAGIILAAIFMEWRKSKRGSTTKTVKA